MSYGKGKLSACPSCVRAWLHWTGLDNRWRRTQRRGRRGKIGGKNKERKTLNTLMWGTACLTQPTTKSAKGGERQLDSCTVTHSMGGVWRGNWELWLAVWGQLHTNIFQLPQRLYYAISAWTLSYIFCKDTFSWLFFIFFNAFLLGFSSFPYTRKIFCIFPLVGVFKLEKEYGRNRDHMKQRKGETVNAESLPAAFKSILALKYKLQHTLSLTLSLYIYI